MLGFIIGRGEKSLLIHSNVYKSGLCEGVIPDYRSHEGQLWCRDVLHKVAFEILEGLLTLARECNHQCRQARRMNSPRSFRFILYVASGVVQSVPYCTYVFRTFIFLLSFNYWKI